jgi:hypothetical protein
MKIASLLYKNNIFFKERNNENMNFNEAQLIIGFGSRELLSQDNSFNEIRNKFPNAQIALCSSAGEVFENEVLDNTISLVALKFVSMIILPALKRVKHLFKILCKKI